MLNELAYQEPNAYAAKYSLPFTKLASTGKPLGRTATPQYVEI